MLARSRFAWLLGAGVAVVVAGCSDNTNGNGGKPDLAMHVGDGDLGRSSFDFGSLDPACANVTAQAKLNKVDLVFLLDRSGSMGDGVNGIRAEKWDPVTQALKAFFADAKSKGLRASFEYFPADGNDICNSSGYYFPDVEMRPLPDTMTFAQHIDAVSPMGGTPTQPAIIGVIDYATDNQKTTTSDRTAIVLVTDGLPDDCMSSVKNTATECANAKLNHNIPTYVIGVGDNLSGLDEIASQGGTDKATIITVGDPTTTSTQFLGALDGIRGTTLSCSFAIPNPQAGAIDFEKVNVEYTPTSGSKAPLPYSTDCSFTSGWRYDDPAAPTKVELCPAICDQVRNEDAGKIEIVFGCATIIF